MLSPRLKALPTSKTLLSAIFIIMSSLIVRPEETRHAAKSTFSVDVEVVNVFVSVRDKNGAFIKDLTQDDFVLSEDGRKQSIRYFSRETDLPLTIGLIVDASPSESNMMEEEKTASRIFLNKMIRQDKDNAFLMQFGDEVELLQDLTSSHKKLAASINLLAQRSAGMPGMPTSPMPNGKPVLRRRSEATYSSNFYTLLSDSIYLASEEILKPQLGRKALIILGDGYHVGERREIAIAAAQEADTLIYTIRIFDKEFTRNSGGFGGGGFGGGGFGGGGFGGGGFGFPGSGLDESAWKKDLKTFSSKTGGTYFETGKKGVLEDIYGKIEEELRSQYSLGYTPDSKAKNGFRKIAIDVKKRGLTAHGREGYYPRSK
jgi:VWFA-related protein